MNHIHRTHRLAITLAGLAAAALALTACQGTATAASHGPHHHHAAQAAVQQMQTGLTFRDLQDLAQVKRDLFRGSAERPADSGLAGCTSLSSPHHVTVGDYPKIRAQFAGSRWPDLRTAGTAFIDLAIQLRHARGTDGYQAVWFYQRLSAACARHGRALSPSV
jgi:hypothetical protein